MPAAWAKALRRAKHQATRNIAWGLLEHAGGNYRGKELYLLQWEAALTGVSRRGRRAAFRELEALGLVELRYEKGAPFAITLLRVK